MKICIVTHRCKPHIGGLETVSFEQAKGLVKNGHSVIIISSNIVGTEPEEFIDGVKFLRVKALHFLEHYFGVPYPIFHPSIFKVLYSEIKSADICILHSIGFASSFFAAMVCCITKTPYILCQQNIYIKYKSFILNLLEKINDRIIGRFIIKHASNVIAISDHVREYISSIYQRDVQVLYVGVDSVQYSPSEAKMSIRNALNLPGEKFIVLTVRRLVFKNAVETLLEVAYRLKDIGNICFVIVGDGAERASLERYVQTNKLNNCTMVGAASDDRVADFYRAADLFVLPSRSEGLAIVVLEAMSSGLPVIVTRAGGQVELVDETVNGFLVDSQEPEQIADIIYEYFDNGNLLREMGKKGREMVENRFTWEIHIIKLIKIINKTLSNTE